MRVFSRLALCSAFLGIISGIFVTFRIGVADLSIANDYTENNLFELVISHSFALIFIFLSGLCVFGWIIVLPVLFYRTYSIVLGLFPFFLPNSKEAAVSILPLLIPFISEIVIIVIFTPISAEFSLSLSSAVNRRFFSRLVVYILSFIITCALIYLSACLEIMILKYG